MDATEIIDEFERLSECFTSDQRVTFRRLLTDIMAYGTETVILGMAIHNLGSAEVCKFGGRPGVPNAKQHKHKAFHLGNCYENMKDRTIQ